MRRYRVPILTMFDVPIQDARLFWVHALLVRLSGNNPLTWHQSHTRAIPK